MDNESFEILLADLCALVDGLDDDENQELLF